MDSITRVEQALRDRGSKKKGQLWNCPAHGDKDPSLSVKEYPDGSASVNCFSAGCSTEAILSAIGLQKVDLLPQSKREEIIKWREAKAEREARKGGVGGSSTPPVSTAHLHTGSPAEDPGAETGPDEAGDPSSKPGITLAQYAAAKGLPVHFLETQGLHDVGYFRHPVVAIEYAGTEGQKGPTHYRHRLLECKNKNQWPPRFTWREGSKYGLWRLELARAAGFIVLVEGESDAHTCWVHDVPAIALPGAGTWKEEEFAPLLEGIPTIYAVLEPDTGGERLKTKLFDSAILPRLRFVSCAPCKDVSGLYLSDRERFRDALDGVLRSATRASDELLRAREARLAEVWSLCHEIARAEKILDLFIEKRKELHAVGEERAASLLFLCMVTRLFPRPVNAIVKGQSSSGKNFTTETVLRFFPPSAFYNFAAMSPRALAYDDEPIAHRMLYINEAAALEQDDANGNGGAYLIRTLLSEGRLIYITVDKSDGKLGKHKLEREGPTGLILTTTSHGIDSETETRMLSIPIDDSPEQTKRVLRALSRVTDTPPPDLSAWHALQEWLESGEHRVEITFAEQIDEKIDQDSVAVRLRRDYGALLSLIRAHALLHRETRDRDQEGRILAQIEDYAAVRELVAEIMAEGTRVAVPQAVRDTVEAVGRLIRWTENEDGVPVVVPVKRAALAKELKLDPSTVSRRYGAAVALGYLENLETRERRPVKLVLGDPLPRKTALLPEPGEIQCATPPAHWRTPLAHWPTSAPTAGDGPAECADSVQECADSTHTPSETQLPKKTSGNGSGDGQCASVHAISGGKGTPPPTPSASDPWTPDEWTTFRAQQARLRGRGLSPIEAETGARALVETERQARLTRGE
jgi:hypothetical protein